MSMGPHSKATEMEGASAAEKPSLEGWVPPMSTDQEIRMALEQAFDYRGDVTITLKDGSTVEGYVFDRRSEVSRLADCYVRVWPCDGDEKLVVRYDQIARVEFSGRDAAAGKSFETWVRKQKEKKAVGGMEMP